MRKPRIGQTSGLGLVLTAIVCVILLLFLHFTDGPWQLYILPAIVLCGICWLLITDRPKNGDDE